MVPRSLGVSSASELDGAEVCVQTGTTTELNLADFFRANGMTFKPVVYESFEESKVGFFNGRCQVYTTDASGLASIRAVDAPNPDDYVRAVDAPNPDDYVILPEILLIVGRSCCTFSPHYRAALWRWRPVRALTIGAERLCGSATM